ncbi:MAG: DUF4920 domain-containing protein [Flavobacteriaceae bacterium]
MKSFNILLAYIVLIAIPYCSNLRAQDSGSDEVSSSEMVFGESFELSDIKNDSAAVEVFDRLEGSEVTEVQLQAEVLNVCQVKGCWMVLDLDGGVQARVTFKDYGFFVPMDIVGKEVIVHGLAQMSEISEDDRKHYAKDAGQPEEEINRIVGSEKTYSLIADGVVVRD